MKTNMYSNLNTKVRVAGVFDYKSVAIFLSIILAICSICSILNINFKFAFIVICIFLPFGIVLLFCSTKNEDSLSVISNVIRFYLNKKIYIKDYNDIRRNLKLFGKIFVKEKNNINRKDNKKIIIRTIINNFILKIKR